MTQAKANFYDAELARHNEALRAAAAIGRDERVLDIGCGAGQTTRQAARAAAEGFAVGIDLSSAMLEVARERASTEGLRNIRFEQGDAECHAYVPASFDVCISRFGVMFFADPAAAFARIAGALRPGGRVAWLVWQDFERNEWARAIQQALAPGRPLSREAAKAFSLGSPSVAEKLLGAAGFVSLELREVDEPVFYGRDAAEACDALSGLYCLQEATDAAARRRLYALLRTHQRDQGVLFGSRAWLVTARRPSGEYGTAGP